MSPKRTDKCFLAYSVEQVGVSFPYFHVPSLSEVTDIGATGVQLEINQFRERGGGGGRKRDKQTDRQGGRVVVVGGGGGGNK